MESPLKRFFGARPDVFISIVVAAFLLSFVSGIATLVGLDAARDDDIRSVVAMVQILFSMLCLSLVLLTRLRGASKMGATLFVVFLAIVCLFQLYSGGAGMVWFIVFPPVATTTLGPRRGSRASFYFGMAAFFLLFAPLNPTAASLFEPGTSFALVYLVVAALSVHSAYRAEAASQASRDASAETGSPAQIERAAIVEVEGSSVPSEGVQAGEADEIVVFYRTDALATIEKIPDPEAVFSYLLLEGMSSPRLLGSDSPSHEPAVASQPTGEYERRAFSIDDLLTKVEAVIDVREAKKLMEFNKIQSQIDSILSRDSDDESGFDRLCFEHNLSEREAAVAKCILKGATNKEISTELFISVETVKTHVKNLLKKCGINSRIDFIKLFSKF